MAMISECCGRTERPGIPPGFWGSDKGGGWFAVSAPSAPSAPCVGLIPPAAAAATTVGGIGAGGGGAGVTVRLLDLAGGLDGLGHTGLSRGGPRGVAVITCLAVVEVACI